MSPAAPKTARPLKATVPAFDLPGPHHLSGDAAPPPPMTAPDFAAFFATAIGGQTPYAYQRRLAGAPEYPAASGPFPCQSQLISIPMGLAPSNHSRRHP